ncbi:MAG: IstB ATP binding domain-containing protein, partial [Candidatus Magnetoglobus multicellularis str. Araruama]
MNDELIKKLKHIRLMNLLTNWNKYIELARNNNFSHTRLLTHVIDEEYQIKKENSRKRRLSRAKIPENLVMETFPFSQQPKLNKKKILSIYDSFDYISKKQNIIWIGPTGTGKTG